MSVCASQGKCVFVACAVCRECGEQCVGVAAGLCMGVVSVETRARGPGAPGPTHSFSPCQRGSVP